MRRLVFLVLVACGGQPTPTAQQPTSKPEAAVVVTAPKPARQDFEVGPSPMSVVVGGNCLVWTDGAGAIFTMPLGGGTPAQLSEQHKDGFMFHPVVAGGEVFVSTKRDFVRVGLPAGPVTKLGLALPEDPEEVVADDQFIYVTLFKRDEVLAIPVRGGAPVKLGTIRRGVLATYGGTLYAVSYATGALVAFSATGSKQIASGFVRPTALAIDGQHAFVYSEKEKSIKAVDLASGAAKTIAEGLENSDDLLADGDSLYTVSWPAKLVRIPKDGSHAPEVLAGDLASPYRIAVTRDAVFVTSRDQNKIVRIQK